VSRVGLFLANLADGGAERSTLNVAIGLADRGHAVDLVLARAEGKFLSHVPPSVRVIDLGAKSTLLSVPQLARYLRRERPVALFSALEHVNVAALLARKFTRAPLRSVISLRNQLSLELGAGHAKRGQLIGRLARRLYPGADAIVSVSNGVADDAATFLGLPRLRIQTIYNPVINADLRRRRELPPQHPWLLEKSIPVVITVGRLNSQKDHATLLRAFAQTTEAAGARLVVFGEGDLRADLTALRDDLGMRERVDFPGFCDNPYAEMRACDLFVLSSRFEGLPGVLIQALACGAQVVSTDCPSGPHEILQGGRLGPLVPVGDVGALARAIGGSLAQPRGAASEQDLAPFTEERVLGQYESVLNIG
jgi:glycosyltransferase involved in cell wall biosynthesis